MTSALSRLIATVSAAAADGGSPRQVVEAIEPTLRDVVDRGSFLEPRFTRLAEGKTHAVYLVHCDPHDRFTMLTGIWHPGAATDVHDHGGHWAIDVLLRGTLTVTEYERVDDGGCTDHAKVEPRRRVQQRPGDVVPLLAPDSDIHQVSNPGPEPALTFHVNGFDLATELRHSFDPSTGCVKVAPGRATYDEPPAG